MRVRHFGYSAALAAAFLMSAAVAAANCQLQLLGTLPVDMQGLKPLVSVKINGVEALFVLDSGAYFSMLWQDSVAQYQLPERGRIATVESLEFLGVPIHKIQFLVIDQTYAYDYVGVIGQNVLRLSDVEYDLANGTVRFFKPAGCEHQGLAYWATNTPYTAVNLEPIDATDDHLLATAVINGKRVTVGFDTGASQSMLSLRAAARAGITPDGAGVTFLGLGRGFLGSSKVWSAPVDTFQLGGEKVQHTHLLISDLDLGNQSPDMLLGEDFFLSHRVYVAYSQRKLYFTYNGGPLFNLNLPEFTAAAPKSPMALAATSQASSATVEQPYADTPTDGDGFRRQGLAYASMQELDLALADLTRACELEPKNADAHYDRGLIYSRKGQFKPALQDFSAAITLQPDDIDARLARANLLQSHPDADPTAAREIKSDLDTVSRLSVPAATVRVELAQLYAMLGDYPAAMDQLDQWLGNHHLRGDQITGLNERCWLRAAANRDLNEALQECNRALNLKAVNSNYDPNILNSRALVYLRLGNLGDAIRDYNSALQTNPNMPTSLYGRGVAELRLGEKAQGDADLAAAEKLDSGIVKQFARMGLDADGHSP